MLVTLGEGLNGGQDVVTHVLDEVKELADIVDVNFDVILSDYAVAIFDFRLTNFLNSVLKFMAALAARLPTMIAAIEKTKATSYF